MLIGGGLGVFCALLSLSGAFHSASARLQDRFHGGRQPDDRIAIVAINDASIARIGRWPWDRSVHADLIRALTKAGALIIAYDVNFSETQNGEADADLASAIQVSQRVILPTELSISNVDGRLTADPKQIVSPLSIFGNNALGTGFSNTPPDDDGIVRSIPLIVYVGGEHSEVSSFAYEAAQAFDASMSTATAPKDRLNRIRISYAGEPGTSYPIYSSADILQGRFDESELKGKLVFVGSTASDLHDEQLVPTSFDIPMPGVEIHASFADTLLGRYWIHLVPSWLFILWLFGLGLFLGYIVAKLRVRWSVLIVLLTVFGAFVFSALLFEIGWALDILWTLFAIILSFIGAVIERRVTAEKDRRSLRRTFEHYVSPSVVDLIVRDPSQLKLGGERKRMTVLFSDICVFTALTDSMEPERLIHMLNIYFGKMTEEVFMHKGVLDKYMGDGLMAFWNAPFNQHDHALLAVESALAMHETLGKLNRLGTFGNPPWKMGIGINTGDMIVGNVGGENHADYTVIGDAVNLASRLEGLTREYRVGVIISEETANALDGFMLLRRLDHVVVKGRFQTVTIYEVICEMAKATDVQKELVHSYETALDAYCLKNFDAVIYQCRQILIKHPNDAPTLLLNDRARMFLASPPPKGWDGTWVYTEK